MQHKNFMNWLLAFFLAKHIECFTQYGSCPDKYNIVLQELYGYPLYFKLPRNEYNAKFSIFPDVAQVNLYRRLPSTIIANIQLRKAIGIKAKRKRTHHPRAAYLAAQDPQRQDHAPPAESPRDGPP